MIRTLTEMFIDLQIQTQWDSIWEIGDIIVHKHAESNGKSPRIKVFIGNIFNVSTLEY